MNLTLKTGTQSQYDALESYDSGTLYFISDTQKIYKGNSEYTKSVIVATVLPTSGQQQGKLYVVGTDGYVYDGTEFKKIFTQDNIPTIVNDLTTGGTTSALSAEQGKQLKSDFDTHTQAVATDSSLGHVKSGADVVMSADGLITVKNIDGTAWTTLKKNIDDAIAAKASLTGATFTGDVVVPATPTGDTSATSKKYVDDTISSRIAANDYMVFKGTIGTSGTVTALPSTYSIGDSYRVVTAGTYAGQVCEVGDIIVAIVDVTAEGTPADTDWTVIQTNVDGVVIGPASATDSTLVVFDGATGKQIKGSEVTLTSIQTAVSDSHTHTNATQLATYDKTQSELLSSASTDAAGKVSTHAEVAASATQLGHIKIGTTASDAAAGDHGHKLIDLLDLDVTEANLLDGQELYYDATAKKWKARTETNYKYIDTAKADEIVYIGSDGTIQASGKKFGGSQLAETPDVNTLATELAVSQMASSAVVTWGTL